MGPLAQLSIGRAPANRLESGRIVVLTYAAKLDDSAGDPVCPAALEHHGSCCSGWGLVRAKVGWEF